MISSPGQGITNIGRHPENDIVIDSPAVAVSTPCSTTASGRINWWW